MTARIVSFDEVQKKSKEKQLYTRWNQFYLDQTHEDLLEALVFEHENDFPLRKSPEVMDQMRHRALVDVLQQRAQTEFLKSLLQEIGKA